MRIYLSRFCVLLACAPLLLCLRVSRGQGREATDVLDLGEITRLQSLTETPFAFGNSLNRAGRMGVEILPIATQQMLTRFEEIQPTEANRPRIRKYLEDLRKLQANYTTTGKLDEAFVLRESIEEIMARQAGVEPDPGNLTGFRNQVGQVHKFHVTGHLTGSVWGSGVYTDDSDLGAAAVHAGLLREGQRGVVKVTILPGQEHYEESESNGITSRSYETWEGSYTLAAGSASPSESHSQTMPDEARKLVEALTRGEGKGNVGQLWQGIDRLNKMLKTAQQAEKLDESLAIREGMRALVIKMAGARPDPGQLTALRNQVGKSFYFVVVGRITGSLWGSETYTDDSDLGTAAVHAGLLRPGQPGIIKVTIRPGCDSYEGSESNGVASGSYPAYPGSYEVSAYRLPAR